MYESFLFVPPAERRHKGVLMNNMTRDIEPNTYKGPLVDKCCAAQMYGVRPKRMEYSEQFSTFILAQKRRMNVDLLQYLIDFDTLFYCFCYYSSRKDNAVRSGVKVGQ